MSNDITQIKARLVQLENWKLNMMQDYNITKRISDMERKLEKIEDRIKEIEDMLNGHTQNIDAHKY